MGLYKRGLYWWYDFQCKGKRYQRNTGETERMAAELVQDQARRDVGKPLRQQREELDPGCYFLLSQNTGLVKVGCSGNVTERLKVYITTNPEKLMVLAKLPIIEYRFAEKTFHDFLKPFHSHGEWYEITPRHVEAAIVFWATGHRMFDRVKRVPVRQSSLEAGS